MDIVPLGHSSYKIRGKSATIVTDPFDSTMVGYSFPKHIAADIITVSHDHHDHNAVESIEGTPYVVKGPGEYDVKGVQMIGISTFHDGDKGAKRGKNVIYHIEIDGINIVHLGDLGHMLSTSDVELLDGVDILFIPVGGDVTLNASQAATLISEIEPKVIIPMHYKTDKLNDKVFASLSDVKPFLKAMGKEDVVPTAKFSVTKDKLPTETQVVVLE